MRSYNLNVSATYQIWVVDSDGQEKNMFFSDRAKAIATVEGFRNSGLEAGFCI